MAAHTGPTPDEDRLRDIRSLTDAALSRLDDRDLIGVAPDARRQVSTVKIPPGTVLCLYTDGLAERREYPIDEGLARLCRAVTTQPPEDVCASVMSALVGADLAHDDIALLTFRRQPEASEGLPSGKAGRR
jgi:serine phosphatase RsbU (regulator of sigma subunit)